MYGEGDNEVQKLPKKEKDDTKVEFSDYIPDDEMQIVKLLTTCGLLDWPDRAYWR